MSGRADEFRSIEIDALDDKLAETAKRKRIPSLTIAADAITPNAGDAAGVTAERPSVGMPGPEPTHRPGVEAARAAVRRRPLSLEVPEYLARELRVKAATETVTVRFLVLSALVEAGYRVDESELEEDGRRLR